jgi:hypothetical protein
MRHFLALSGLAVAMMTGATDANAFRALGAGTYSCGSWTTHRPEFGVGRVVTHGSQIALEQMQWVIGFLSGVGDTDSYEGPAVHQG